jgi:hypothetical protein
LATQTLSTFDTVLKDLYRGPIVELLNQELYLITWVEKQNVNDMGTFTGRRVIFPVHTGRNRGRGGTTDGGALSNAGIQSYLDGIETPKYLNTGVELTDMTIEQTKSDEGAFIRALESEMDGGMKDLRKDASRMAYGTGDGLLATVSATSSGSATITVDNGQYIAVGDTVDVLVKSTGATIANGTAVLVTAVVYNGAANSATQAQAQVTLGGGNVSVTAATNGVYITGDRGNECNGLRNMLEVSRTLHSINSVTYPIWDSNKLDAGQSNPSEDQFMQIAQRARMRSGFTIDRFLTTYGVQRRLANTYTSQKRWNDNNATQIDGGYEAIMVSAGGKPTPVVADVDAVNGTVFALNQGSFAWCELAPPDWLTSPEGPGQIFHLKDGSTAGTKLAIWQAWIRWYAQFICVAPHRSGKIINLNDDIPIQRA